MAGSVPVDGRGPWPGPDWAERMVKMNAIAPGMTDAEPYMGWNDRRHNRALIRGALARTSQTVFVLLMVPGTRAWANAWEWSLSAAAEWPDKDSSLGRRITAAGGGFPIQDCVDQLGATLPIDCVFDDDKLRMLRRTTTTTMTTTTWWRIST